MSTIDRVLQLAKEKGISQAFICGKLGLRRTYLSDVRLGKDSLPDDRLSIIADILSTTPEYLKGETDVKEKPTSRSKPDYIIKFDSLPEKDRKEVIALIEYKAAHLHDERK